MDTKKLSEKTIKLSTFRPEGLKRVFSNYVEISKSSEDISLRFSDIKPPVNKNEIELVNRTGELKLPVEVEIVMPLKIATSFLQVLKGQLEKKVK